MSYQLASGSSIPTPDGHPEGSAWRLVERIGEGATCVVWRAEHRQTRSLAALKAARPGDGASELIAREAAILARVARRWGPALVDAGPGFLATQWVEGAAIDPARVSGNRESLAAVVAHAVGRALAELHDAGVRHGDVKPANVLLAPAVPTRDVAQARGATLIDLGLAVDLGAEALGGTPRYAAPELREGGETGTAADLWALGLLLAELLDPRAAGAAEPRSVVATWGRAAESEPARWVEALVAAAPGGRPNAAWVASRAARWLRLRADEDEEQQSRIDRVRRAYMAERSRDVRAGAKVSEAIRGAARDWLADAIAWAGKLGPPSESSTVEPLGAVRRARWLVGLAGPSASAWPIGTEEDRAEGDLVDRA
ncbi:MAG TPA: protein kinase, partial [Polyangiaceae bacterium]|nr:protein kinase [Polyangiaceae bacterium]